MRQGILRYLLQNQIIVALLFVALAWFLLQIVNILVGVFIAYIIMAALLPFVRFLQKYRVPRAVAATISYLFTMLLLVVLVMPLLPFFSEQIQTLLTNFPKYLNIVAEFLHISINSDMLQEQIAPQINEIGKNALTLTGTIFSGVFFFLTIFVIGFYLLLDHERFIADISSIFPKSSQKNVHDFLEKVEEKLGSWLRGQFVLCVSIGIVTWIALTLLGLPFALPLAILAGILEIVPTLGPILSAVPAVIVAAAISPTLMLGVVITYIIIQMLENNILVPKIMERAVGLNPIIIIIGVMIGGHMLGVLGALLSIPFISILTIAYKTARETPAS